MHAYIHKYIHDCRSGGTVLPQNQEFSTINFFLGQICRTGNYKMKPARLENLVNLLQLAGFVDFIICELPARATNTLHENESCDVIY